MQSVNSVKSFVNEYNYSSVLLPDWKIEELGIVTPCEKAKKRPGVISYGLSSYGYDARVGSRYKIVNKPKIESDYQAEKHKGYIIDPKNISEELFEEIETDKCIIPPNSFVLAETVETFCIPRNVLCVCVGKSTYARCGIIVNVTPLEPEWKGKITVEISNTTPVPTLVYSNEGIMQILFFQSSLDCNVSYQDKNGKYQNQSGLVLPMVDK